ncbi:hypothetical protein Micbo1qcDRAFT_220397 [Microdochium bolleyi]|uniref:Uncharacterized protein n=1 Tax=Microdochium bolleyi TaxID=196109 RepID=A0A136J9D2_9PEZI|nr:hypothetical protein Micbo1qcDRAFT_220397 [Microdochium bolleyi]
MVPMPMALLHVSDLAFSASPYNGWHGSTGNPVVSWWLFSIFDAQFVGPAAALSRWASHPPSVTQSYRAGFHKRVWRRRAALVLAGSPMRALHATCTSKYLGTSPVLVAGSEADFLSAILQCLRGDLKARHMGIFDIQNDPIAIPLEEVASLPHVQSFYESQGQLIRASCLTKERKTLWSRFAREVVLAYTSVAAPPPRTIPATSMQSPIQHILNAIALITELRDHDARSPVRSAELVPFESEQANSKAEEYWREVKLESLRPCLLLAVRVLEVMLPDRMDYWEEYRESLHRKEWKDTFINDSPRSRESTLMGPSDLAELRPRLRATRR